MKIHALDLVVDLNRDGTYSGWELWEAIKFLYRLPGNLLTEALGHVPYLSSALDIQASASTGYDSLNGLFSVTLSLIFWVLVVFALLSLASPDTDDDTATQDARPNTLQRADVAPVDASSASSGHGSPVRDSGGAVHTGLHALGRTHLPVSRPAYAIPGKKPKRRHHHHLVHTLMRHAK
jgi:hypothetical protein